MAGLIRVIATDIDGTLISHTGALPAVNRQAVQEAARQGVKLALVSVRKRNACAAIGDLLGVPYATIGQGGATVHDTDGALLFQQTIPLHVAQAIAQLCDDEQIPLLTTVDEQNIRGPHTNLPSVIVDEIGQVPRNTDALTGPPGRLIVYGESGVNRVMERFATAPLRFVRHYTTAGELVDVAITHRDATKEAALELLLCHWGIAWEEVMALGDSESDAGMIERAGLGVAPADALPQVRAIANLVGPPAADGLLAAAWARARG